MRAFSLFTATMMAAVSLAVEEEVVEPASDWDNMCFHCINEGNLYCAKEMTKDTDGNTYKTAENNRGAVVSVNSSST